MGNGLFDVIIFRCLFFFFFLHIYYILLFNTGTLLQNAWMFKITYGLGRRGQNVKQGKQNNLTKEKMPFRQEVEEPEKTRLIGKLKKKKKTSHRNKQWGQGPAGKPLSQTCTVMWLWGPPHTILSFSLTGFFLCRPAGRRLWRHQRSGTVPCSEAVVRIGPLPPAARSLDHDQLPPVPVSHH